MVQGNLDDDKVQFSIKCTFFGNYNLYRMGDHNEFGKKGEVIEKSENVTIDKLQKENTKLKAKIKELEALK